MKRILLTMLAVMASPAMASPFNSTPEWKSYQQTGNPADIVSSPQVAAVFGTKIDATNGQAQNLQIQGGNQTVTAPAGDNGTFIANTGYVDRAAANLLSVVQAGFLANTGGTVSGATTFQQSVNLNGGVQNVTPAASDNGTSIPNTFYVTRAVANALASIPADPTKIGFQVTYKTTINVCPTGCTYSDPTVAWANAVSQAHKLNGTLLIEIDIADGTYNLANNFYVPDPMGKFINVIGNTTNPQNVVLNFINTKGNNFNAVDASNGGIVGFLDGVTITQPTDGSGALASTDSNGRHSWNSQSYGGAVVAYGAGSNIQLGGHVIIKNFYYSLIADDLGGVYAPNGLTMSLAGDVNAMARGGGTIVCLGCAASDASDVSWGENTLGSNFDAERGGHLYIDGSTVSKALVNGVVAQTGGSVWAHNMKFTGPLVSASGSALTGWTGGHIEATGSAVSGGYYAGLTAADMAIVTCDSCSLSGSQVGIVADGGRAKGSSMTITNNTQFGIQAIHQGSVVAFDTYSRMSGNGANLSVQSAGTTSGSGSSYAASSADVQ